MFEIKKGTCKLCRESDRILDREYRCIFCTTEHKEGTEVISRTGHKDENIYLRV